jgi:hypothetical protein
VFLCKPSYFLIDRLNSINSFLSSALSRLSIRTHHSSLTLLSTINYPFEPIEVIDPTLRWPRKFSKENQRLRSTRLSRLQPILIPDPALHRVDSLELYKVKIFFRLGSDVLEHRDISHLLVTQDRIKYREIKDST